MTITDFFLNFAQGYIFMSYTKMCNKKDRSPDSFSRKDQIEKRGIWFPFPFTAMKILRFSS